MNKPYCQDDKRDPHRQQPLTGHLESMREDHRDLDLASRRAIDVAIGILMGLRGCQKNEAVDEFLSAVGESGVGSTELGQALADLVSGEETSMHRAEALRRWSRLVALRERPVRRVPYGRYNKSTMC